MTIHDLIVEAIEKGFTVFVPKELTTYFFFSKDNKVGYCQVTKYDGVSFSTVHKANKISGTGYKVDSFDDALKNRPHWALFSDPVVKYASLDEFLTKNWQLLFLFDLTKQNEVAA
jgi:hypothetical protein